MQIPNLNPVFLKIFGQIFRHLFRQRRNQRPLALGNHLAAFRHQIVNLVFHRLDHADRIHQPRRADNLLGKHAVALFQFPVAGRRRNENRRRAEPVPFLKLQRPVVHARRQSEPVISQRGFAVAVAAIHAADLRHRNVALVNKQQRVFRKILKQRRRRFARRTSGQIA